VGDRLALRNVTRLAANMGMELVQVSALDEFVGVSPAAVIIDLELRQGLELQQGLDMVLESKARWPLAMVVGLVTMPGGDVWRRGEDAGCDFVTTRGAVAKSVPARLLKWMKKPGGRRLHLFGLGDVAGRLGVVDRIEDPVVGWLAVYHVGGKVCVAQDRCPHAGALLSHGDVDVDDGVVTCPEHGSRFDVCTGDRVRGPADAGLSTYRVVIEDGQVYVQLDGR
jgi:nitrite reductase/ring-hydroxylating ferredoxin subunit